LTRHNGDKYGEVCARDRAYCGEKRDGVHILFTQCRGRCGTISKRERQYDANVRLRRVRERAQHGSRRVAFHGVLRVHDPKEYGYNGEQPAPCNKLCAYVGRPAFYGENAVNPRNSDEINADDNGKRVFEGSDILPHDKHQL